MRGFGFVVVALALLLSGCRGARPPALPVAASPVGVFPAAAPAGPEDGQAAPAVSGDAVSGDAGAGGEALAEARRLVETLPTRALLVRGPYAFRGLPSFPPNAVPGLAGEYLLSAAAAGLPEEAAAPRSLALRVWYSREPLVFGEGWKRASLGPYPSYELKLDSSPRLLLAVLGEGHELFLELPRDSSGLRVFALALERKFAQFFADSASDAELSFPAYVDLPR